jgi:hypothetical protein
MTKHDVERVFVAVVAVGLSGCVAWMRDPDFYADELSELLEAHAEPIEACYDRFLTEQDPDARGTVAVEFVVEKQTGRLTNIEVANSTVPDRLAACVTDELAQARLDPPDAKTAQASFTWEFVRGPQKRPPADPFAGASIAILACYSTHLAKVDREAQGDLVIDYAFSREAGELERLELVAAATTAPEPVVECAIAAIRSLRLDPEQLEDRNIAGRRSFALRYEPHQESG